MITTFLFWTYLCVSLSSQRNRSAAGVPWTIALVGVQVFKRKWTLFSWITTSAFQINRSLYTQRIWDYIEHHDYRYPYRFLQTVSELTSNMSNYRAGQFCQQKLLRSEICPSLVIAESLGRILWKSSDGHTRVRKFIWIKWGFHWGAASKFKCHFRLLSKKKWHFCLFNKSLLFIKQKVSFSCLFMNSVPQNLKVGCLN